MTVQNDIKIPAQEMSPIDVRPKHSLKWYEHGAVSMAAMGAAITGYHPFIALKFKMQAVATEMKKNAAAQTMPSEKGYKRIAKLLDPRFLVKGYVVNMLNAPIYAVMGTINGIVNDHFSNNGQKKLSEGEKLGIATASSVFGSVFTNALDFYIIQKQEYFKRTKGGKISAWKLFKDLTREGGIRVNVRGMMPTQFREMPFIVAGLYFVDAMKPKIMPHIPANWYLPKVFGDKQEFYSSFFSGAIIGTVAAAITQPADVIKTTMQKDWKRIQYPQMTDAAKAIFKEGGMKAFFTGFTPRWLAFMIAISMLGVTTPVFKSKVEEM